MQITVLGDGSFGTALAQTLARNGHHITLWCNNSEVAHSIELTRRNDRYMPNRLLLPTIKATTSLQDAFIGSSWIVEAIPMIYLRSVLVNCAPFTHAATRWVLSSKGIEYSTGYLATDLLLETLQTNAAVVLSGPSFAQELFDGHQTALTLASQDIQNAYALKELLNQDTLTIECLDDYLGVQWCGALKNIIALALGIVDGAGYGANSQALIYTCMVRELEQLLLSQKLNRYTIFSYAGIGDIALTSYNDQSRNRSLGKALGRKEYVEKQHLTTEGLTTLKALPICIELSKAPVFEATYKIVFMNQEVLSLFDACKKHKNS